MSEKEYNKQAVEMIAEKIIDVVNQKTKNICYDKTFLSTVVDVKDDIYVIEYLGKKYKVTNSIPYEFQKGEQAWIKIPNNNIKNMHICGFYKKKKN